MPAVSLYLYNVTLDEEGVGNNRSGQYIDVEFGEADRSERSPRRPCGCVSTTLISCWAQTPEEEQLLLGATIRAFMEHPTIRGDQLRATVFEPDDTFLCFPRSSMKRCCPALVEPESAAEAGGAVLDDDPAVSDDLRGTFTRFVREREVRFSIWTN